MKAWVTLTAAFVAIGVALSINAQELKKCVDTNGKVTYSDQACVAGDATTSIRVSTAVSSGPSDQNIDLLVTHNMRMLRACESRKNEACFEKEIIEKRCLLQRKKGTGIPLSDCKDFESERSKFLELLSACKREKREDACLFLSCAGGETKSCELMKAAEEKKQKINEKRIEFAQKQGLPSGYGWFMSQDWHTSSDGSQAAIVTCNNPGKPNNGNTSVALRKKPPMSHLILTGSTGNEYFTTVEEAARKACSRF